MTQDLLYTKLWRVHKTNFHQIKPTAYPPIIPVIRRLGFVDTIPLHSWRAQSQNIIAMNKTRRVQWIWIPEQQEMKEITLPILTPKQRAHNGIGSPRIIKLRSGIWWQPSSPIALVIIFILFMLDILSFPNLPFVSTLHANRTHLVRSAESTQ